MNQGLKLQNYQPKVAELSAKSIKLGTDVANKTQNMNIFYKLYYNQV